MKVGALGRLAEFVKLEVELRQSLGQYPRVHACMQTSIWERILSALFQVESCDAVSGRSFHYDSRDESLVWLEANRNHQQLCGYF